MVPPRFDFTFSYWILAWFALYSVDALPYSPKIWLLLGIAHNLMTIALMFYYNNSALNLALFSVTNIVIKVIPLWYLRKTGYYTDDFLFGAALFALHLLWLSENKSSYPQFLKTGLQRIKQDLPVGPTEYYATKYLKQYHFII